MNDAVPQAAIWRWLGLALCVGVLVVALLPHGEVSKVTGVDKALHFWVFASLGGWFCALSNSQLRILISIAGLACFGAAIEILQSFTGRDLSLRDLAADLVGIGLGFLLLRGLFARGLSALERGVRPARE